MRSLRWLIVLSLVAAAWPFSGRAQTTAVALFQEALTLERAEGRLDDAVFRYERVVAEFPAERPVVAQALYQLALTYEKRRDPRAELMLTRLANDFATASPFAAEAKKKLAARQQGAAQGPFASRTLDPEFGLGSPDGKLVVYWKNGVLGRLYVRELGSGAERVLVDSDGTVSNFAWSPDSRELAFEYGNQAQKLDEIRIVTIATGAIRSLAVHAYPTAWTKGGDLFCYRPNYAANTVDWSLVPAAGGEPRKILAAPIGEIGYVLITPDGASLVADRNKKLVLIDVATGAERPITSGSADETNQVVSADGRLVAFQSNPDGRWALFVAPLDRLPVRTPVRIADVPLAAGTMDRSWWTADGLLTVPIPHSEQNIYRVEMDKSTGHAIDAPQRLTQDAPLNFDPSASPDSRSVAYYYGNGMKGGIAVMEASGASERPLLEQAGSLDLFWRSPEELLFYDFATASGQKPAITALNIRTGARQAVAQVEGLYWYYIPARKEILHLYPGGGGARPGAVLKAHSLVDGTDRVVATIDNLMPWLAVAPDGRRFAYSTTSDELGASPRCDVAIMTLDGVREKVLVPPQQPCAVPGVWSPDGRFLLLNVWRNFTADETLEPRVANVDTGESWPLHADMANQTGWTAGTWAPDGSFIALTRSSSRKERLAWEGVTYDAVTRLIDRK